MTENDEIQIPRSSKMVKNLLFKCNNMTEYDEIQIPRSTSTPHHSLNYKKSIKDCQKNLLKPG